MCALEQKKLYFKPCMLNTFPSEGGRLGRQLDRRIRFHKASFKSRRPEAAVEVSCNVAA